MGWGLGELDNGSEAKANSLVWCGAIHLMITLRSSDGMVLVVGLLGLTVGFRL